ncbi:Conserved_hypothetical protein [Hexamita inflata]|uniref:Uncharacterized protein n=1 Tax=Hexamita inflata TaxID=28002 RepID=A0AA86Q444_9EUKA|nr:Conserved hypothetical protein [Hexamita inflata]
MSDDSSSPEEQLLPSKKQITYCSQQTKKSDAINIDTYLKKQVNDRIKEVNQQLVETNHTIDPIDFQLIQNNIQLPFFNEEFATFMPEPLENQWYFRFNTAGNISEVIEFQFCNAEIFQLHKKHGQFCVKNRSKLSAKAFQSDGVRVLVAGEKNKKQLLIIPDYFSHPFQLISFINSCETHGYKVVLIYLADLQDGNELKDIHEIQQLFFDQNKHIQIISQGSTTPIACELSKMIDDCKLLLINPLVNFHYIQSPKNQVRMQQFELSKGDNSKTQSSQMPRIQTSEELATLEKSQSKREQQPLERKRYAKEIPQPLSPKKADKCCINLDMITEKEQLVFDKHNLHITAHVDESAIQEALQNEIREIAVDAINELEHEMDEEADEMDLIQVPPVKDITEFSQEEEYVEPNKIDHQLSKQEYDEIHKMSIKLSMSDQIRHHHFSTTEKMITDDVDNAQNRSSINLHSMTLNSYNLVPIVVKQNDSISLYTLLNDCMRIVYNDENLIQTLCAILQQDKVQSIKLLQNLSQLSSIYSPFTNISKMRQKFFMYQISLNVFAPVQYFQPFILYKDVFDKQFFKAMDKVKVIDYNFDLKCDVKIILSSHSCQMTKESLISIQEINSKDNVVARTVLGAGHDIFWMANLLLQVLK